MEVDAGLDVARQIPRRAVEYDPAMRQGDDAVGDAPSQVDLVQTDQGGEAVLPADRPQEVEDLPGGGGVEAGDRFVGEDQGRALDQGAGDPDALSDRPTRARASRARRISARGGGRMPANSGWRPMPPTMALARAVQRGNNWWDWKTIAVSSRWRRHCVAPRGEPCPSVTTQPEVGTCRPLHNRNKVDLPDPERPRRTVKLPGSRRSDTSSTARMPPGKSTVTCWSEIMAGRSAAGVTAIKSQNPGLASILDMAHAIFIQSSACIHNLDAKPASHPRLAYDEPGTPRSLPCGR